MSFWYEAKKDDLSLDDQKKEIHVWLASDYAGNIYASIPIKLVKELLKKEGVR